MLVISLFDFTGYMLKPWKDAGHETVAVDILHRDPEAERFKPSKVYFGQALALDLSKPKSLKQLIAMKPDFVFGFPPCTDLAVSGAKHFKPKAAKDPNFQQKAMKLARSVEKVGEGAGCPWGLENPVGVMSRLWRKPDFVFHPWMYSGSLPTYDKHPDWPEYIPARDLYTKRTCFWCGNGLWMPEATCTQSHLINDGKQYSNTFYKLGGTGLKTKIIRSATPRGFAQAIFDVNG